MAREHAAEHHINIGLLIESMKMDSMISGQGPFIDGLEAKLSFSGAGNYLVAFNI
jgi:hypothetical protein